MIRVTKITRTSFQDGAVVTLCIRVADGVPHFLPCAVAKLSTANARRADGSVQREVDVVLEEANKMFSLAVA